MSDVGAFYLESSKWKTPTSPRLNDVETFKSDSKFSKSFQSKKIQKGVKNMIDDFFEFPFLSQSSCDAYQLLEILLSKTSDQDIDRIIQLLEAEKAKRQENMLEEKKKSDAAIRAKYMADVEALERQAEEAKATLEKMEAMKKAAETRRDEALKNNDEKYQSGRIRL